MPTKKKLGYKRISSKSALKVRLVNVVGTPVYTKVMLPRLPLVLSAD